MAESTKGLYVVRNWRGLVTEVFVGGGANGVLVPVDVYEDRHYEPDWHSLPSRDTFFEQQAELDANPEANTLDQTDEDSAGDGPENDDPGGDAE